MSSKPPKTPASAAPPARPVPTPQPAAAVPATAVSKGAVANFSSGLLATLAAQAKDVAATERVAVSGISLRAGIMQWQGQPVPGNRMRVIVLSSSYENTYYPEAFDPNNVQSPACFAQSLKDEDMAPHDNSTDQQHENCRGCWAHQWKSDQKGGKGKACKQVRKLAVIPAYDTAEEISTAELATVRIPVMSVKNWSGYANERATLDGLPPFAFVTEMSVRPDPRSQFVVEFAKEGVVADEDALRAVMARIPQAEQLLLTPYEPRPEAEEAPAAPVAAPAGKKKKF